MPRKTKEQKEEEIIERERVAVRSYKEELLAKVCKLSYRGDFISIGAIDMVLDDVINLIKRS